MKCLIDNTEKQFPCSKSCDLFGDCVCEFENSQQSKTTNLNRIKPIGIKEIPEMYKATYKCRMCGETFTSEMVENNMQANVITAMIAMNKHHELNYHLFVEKTPHDCHNGSIGYADFVGFRKENV